MKSTKSLFLVVALLLTTLVAGAGSAFANTAANTQITNAAKLTYTGGIPVTANVSVTVALVPSAPNMTLVAGATAAYTGTNSPKIADILTLTATANGPASYTITPTLVSSSYTSGATVASGGTITLGATTTTGTSTQTSVTVPAGQVGTNSVNGIASGANIVFTVNNHTYPITNVTVSDNGDQTWKISWNASQAIQAADLPGVGVLIAEQKTYEIDALPGTMASAGTNIVVNVNATVATGGVANVTSNTVANNWTTNTSNPNVSLVKYVRNASSNAQAAATGNATGTGATPLTINSTPATYYTGGVTGKPGDTLEYVLVATNNGGTDLAGSQLSDFLPVSFVNLVTGMYGGKDIYYLDPTGTSYPLTAGTTAGSAQATFVAASNPNLVVNVGIGATSSLTGAIPAGKSVTIAYQATIR